MEVFLTGPNVDTGSSHLSVCEVFFSLVLKSVLIDY
jgi:hypothetical protein